MQITLLLFGILQLQFETSPMRIAAVVAGGHLAHGERLQVLVE